MPFVKAAQNANPIAEDIPFTVEDFDKGNFQEKKWHQWLLRLPHIKMLKPKAADKKFTDASDIAAWAVEDVNNAVGLGIINGMDDGSFQPKANATRAQAALQCFQCFGI